MVDEFKNEWNIIRNNATFEKYRYMFYILIPCIFWSQLIKQQIPLIKYNVEKVSNSYMFRHRNYQPQGVF